MGLIRFLLAIGVVFSHAGLAFGFTTLGGSVAVQSFYMISGFYIALILNEKYIGENKSYSLFISNRFLRIYPIYWVVLLLTVLSAFVLSWCDSKQCFISYSVFQKYGANMSLGSWLMMIFSNVFIFFQDVIMFLKFDDAKSSLVILGAQQSANPKLHYFLFVAQAWSVAIELMFYIVAPLFARKKITTILMLITISISIRLMLCYYFNFNKDPWTTRFFPSELLFFLLGIVAYRIYVKIRIKEIPSGVMYSVFVSIVLFTIFYRYIPLPNLSLLYFTLFFVSLPIIFKLSKNWKKDRLIGELSYPIYISHIFVLTWVGKLNMSSSSWRTIVVIVLSVIFAYLLNKFVGERVEQLRQKRLK